MTSKELLAKMSPERHAYVAQFTSRGLEFNESDIFTRLIKEAAKCENYSSDVRYDMDYIEDRMEKFDPKEEFDPIWIGFRKMGVDGTDFVLCRTRDIITYGSISNNYFALYSITVERKDEGWYTVYLTKYPV